MTSPSAAQTSTISSTSPFEHATLGPASLGRPAEPVLSQDDQSLFTAGNVFPGEYKALLRKLEFLLFILAISIEREREREPSGTGPTFEPDTLSTVVSTRSRDWGWLVELIP